MKPITWHQEYRDFLNDPIDREKALAWAQEEQEKWDMGNLKGCDVESLMHEYAYLRMEEALFSMGNKIQENCPWEDVDFIVREFVYKYYGIYYYLESKLKDAEYWFLKSMVEQSQGRDAYIWDWLCCVYAEMGNHKKAIEGIGIMKEYYDKNEKIKYHHAFDFAKYFYSIGMYEEAISDFERYEQSWPTLPSDFFIYKSFCLRELNRMEEGRQCLENGLLRWKNDPEIEVRLAMMIFEDLHDTDRTLELMQKSFETTKDYENWEDWNASIASNISKLFAERADWENAYDYLRQAIVFQAKGKDPSRLLQLINTRPTGEGVDHAQVYVTIDSFLQGSLFQLGEDETDIPEDNPYLVEISNDEAMLELTDPENFIEN